MILMPYRRNERVSSLIQEELSRLILENVEFSGALVTITNVQVDSHLEEARVRISVMPVGKFDEVMLKLSKAKRHLEYLLLRRINIKPMPKIVFEPDYGPHDAAKIEKIVIENEDFQKLVDEKI